MNFQIDMGDTCPELESKYTYCQMIHLLGEIYWSNWLEIKEERASHIAVKNIQITDLSKFIKFMKREAN